VKTYHSICIKDYTIEDSEGNKLELKRGKEYAISPKENGKCVVFSNFWVRVPANLFEGDIIFTK